MSLKDEQYDRIKQLLDLNEQLLDTRATTVMWLIQFSQETRVKLPHSDSLLRLMKESRKIMNEMVTKPPESPLSDDSYHPKASDDKLPKPTLRCC